MCTERERKRSPIKYQKVHESATFIADDTRFLTKIISHFNLFPYFCDKYHQKRRKPIETHYS